MTLPHHIEIMRSGAAAGDGMGGVAVASAGEVVYEGEADVQDGGMIFRSEEGIEIDEGDATAYVPEGVASEVEPGDNVIVTFMPGDERAGTVAMASRLDDTLLIAYD